MAINSDKTRAAAQKYLQNGQLDRAIRAYEQILEDDPNDIRSRLKIGDLQTRQGDLAGATQTYTTAAQYYVEQGFFLKAIAVYKQLLKLDPTLTLFNLRLAELYQQLDLVSDALAHYRLVCAAYEQSGMSQKAREILSLMLTLDPDNAAARIKLAELYVQQGDMPQAHAAFKAAADTLLETDLTDAYVNVLERLSHPSPDDVAVAQKLAHGYIKKGDGRHALAKLQTCFHAKPNDGVTLDLMAQAFIQVDQAPKAAAVLRELIAVYDTAGQMAQRDAAQKRLDEMSGTSSGGRHLEPLTPAAHPPPMQPPAKPLLQDITSEGIQLEHVPVVDLQEAQRLMLEADSFTRYGLRERAEASLRRVLDIHPNLHAAQVRLKALQQDSARQAAAAATRLTASPEPTLMAELTEELDEIHFFLQQGLHEDAREQLEALRQAHPDHPGVVATMGLLDAQRENPKHTGSALVNEALQEELANLEQNDSALEIPFDDIFERFKQGITQAVSHADYDTHYNLGIAYKSMGLLDDAIREFELTQRAPSLKINALMMTGLCLLQGGKTEAALQRFLQGLASPQITAREQVALRYEVAAVYEQLERFADAHKFYEKAYEMDPTFRDVSLRLRETATRQTTDAQQSVSGDLDLLLRDTPALHSPHDAKGAPG